MQDHEYYLARARHAREMAGKAVDPAVRITHTRMAAAYDAMAMTRAKIASLAPDKPMLRVQ
jgi:hypothetical protein